MTSLKHIIISLNIRDSSTLQTRRTSKYILLKYKINQQIIQSSLIDVITKHLYQLMVHSARQKQQQIIMLFMWIYIYIYICICACVGVCVCTHTHLHAHRYETCVYFLSPAVTRWCGSASCCRRCSSASCGRWCTRSLTYRFLHQWMISVLPSHTHTPRHLHTLTYTYPSLHTHLYIYYSAVSTINVLF